MTVIQYVKYTNNLGWLLPSRMIAAVILEWLLSRLYKVALSVCRKTVFFELTYRLTDAVVLFPLV